MEDLELAALRQLLSGSAAVVPAAAKYRGIAAVVKNENIGHSLNRVQETDVYTLFFESVNNRTP
jgi:hypothetical protein